MLSESFLLALSRLVLETTDADVLMDLVQLISSDPSLSLGLDHLSQAPFILFFDAWGVCKNPDLARRSLFFDQPAELTWAFVGG